MSDQNNVKINVKGSKLTIEVDLSKDFGPSKSGKTNVVASTHGFEKIEGGAMVSLNVVKKG